MSSFVIEGTLTVDISGLEGLAGEIRSVSIKALQGEIRKVADQILRVATTRIAENGEIIRTFVTE